MTSLTQIAYGSRVLRQGKSRRSASNQAPSWRTSASRLREDGTLELGHEPRNVRRQVLPAFRRDDDVVLDAHADAPVFGGHARVADADVNPGLDRQHHAGLERAGLLVP